jgi:hypothetical protein
MTRCCACSASRVFASVHLCCCLSCCVLCCACCACWVAWRRRGRLRICSRHALRCVVLQPRRASHVLGRDHDFASVADGSGVLMDTCAGGSCWPGRHSVAREVGEVGHVRCCVVTRGLTPTCIKPGRRLQLPCSMLHLCSIRPSLHSPRPHSPSACRAALTSSLHLHRRLCYENWRDSEQCLAKAMCLSTPWASCHDMAVYLAKFPPVPQRPSRSRSPLSVRSVRRPRASTAPHPSDAHRSPRTPGRHAACSSRQPPSRGRSRALMAARALLAGGLAGLRRRGGPGGREHGQQVGGREEGLANGGRTGVSGQHPARPSRPSHPSCQDAARPRGRGGRLGLRWLPRSPP